MRTGARGSSHCIITRPSVMLIPPIHPPIRGGVKGCQNGGDRRLAGGTRPEAGEG